MGTRALYCTADAIGGGTGGGQVVEHEIAALRRLFDEVTILSRDNLVPPTYRGIDIPLLADYFALAQIGDERYDLGYFYSGTFTETVKALRRAGTVVGYTCPAHDLKVSLAAFKQAQGHYPYPHLEDPQLWRQFSEGLRQADFVVVPSRLSADFLRRERVSGPIFIVPHGHDSGPMGIPTQTQRQHFGYLGQVGPDKNIPTLLQAFDRLDWDNPLVKLVLAGRGTEQLGPLVQRYIGGGKVALLGFVEKKETLWNAIDIYIQPSATESFGIETLEAMAAGKPVIVSDGAGAADLVTSENGVVVPAGDVHALASAMHLMRNRDPGARVAMGLAGQITAAQYTWAEVERKFEEVVRCQMPVLAR